MGPKPGPPAYVLPVFFGAQILFSLVATGAFVLTGPRVFWFEAFLLSVPFSQVSILAAWNALGDSQRFLRPIGSILSVLLLWLICFGMPYISGHFPGEFVVPGIAMFAQWILIQMPLWFVRLKFGWRLGTIDQHTPSDAPSKNVQFGIKHLLIWTTVVGVFLGVARIVLRIPEMHTNDALGFSIFLLCNCLFVWPTVMAGVMNRWLTSALMAAAGITVVISLAEPYVFATLLGTDQTRIFWIVNSIQFVWIAASLLVLRRFGFRLVRAHDSP
jgi:hypothetical protein